MDREKAKQLFEGIQFLGGMYSKNVWLGVFFTVIFVGFWLVMGRLSKKMSWQETIDRAGESLKKVGEEATLHKKNTEAGDDWDPKP